MSKIDKEGGRLLPENDNNTTQYRADVCRVLVEDAVWQEPKSPIVKVSGNWHPRILADTKNRALYDRFSQIELGQIYLAQGPFSPIFGQFVLSAGKITNGETKMEVLKQHLTEEKITELLNIISSDVLKNFPDCIEAQLLSHVVSQRKNGAN